MREELGAKLYTMINSLSADHAYLKTYMLLTCAQFLLSAYLLTSLLWVLWMCSLWLHFYHHLFV